MRFENPVNNGDDASSGLDYRALVSCTSHGKVSQG